MWSSGQWIGCKYRRYSIAIYLKKSRDLNSLPSLVGSLMPPTQPKNFLDSILHFFSFSGNHLLIPAWLALPTTFPVLFHLSQAKHFWNYFFVSFFLVIIIVWFNGFYVFSLNIKVVFHYSFLLLNGLKVWVMRSSSKPWISGLCSVYANYQQ